MRGSLCAFLDASVLYPVSLRNLLMRLTLVNRQALSSSTIFAYLDFVVFEPLV